MNNDKCKRCSRSTKDVFVDASGWLLCAHQESRDADLELLRKRREEVLGAEHGMPSYSSLPEGNNM